MQPGHTAAGGGVGDVVVVGEPVVGCMQHDMISNMVAAVALQASSVVAFEVVPGVVLVLVLLLVLVLVLVACV